MKMYLNINTKRKYSARTFKKSAFTLAEVLITLGIIGVVAAMTLPALVQNYRKHVVETRLVKFYSAINQAIQQSEVENGPKEYWEQNAKYDSSNSATADLDEVKTISINWFNKYLKPYLKFSEVKVNNTNGKVMVYFPDGSLVLIGSNSWLFWPEAKDYVDFYTNESGTPISPIELSGIKYFTFFFMPNSSSKYHYRKGVEPYKPGWDGKITSLYSDSQHGCSKTASRERAFCTALIQTNGWKIPDDYPFKF